jgi:hypothetical protein
MKLSPLYVDLRDTDAIRRCGWNYSESRHECIVICWKWALLKIHPLKSLWDRVDWATLIIVLFKVINSFIFNHSHLHLKLIWIAESLGIFFNMTYKIKAILNVIATDKTTNKWNDCILFIIGNMNVWNCIIFRCDFNTLNKLIWGQEQGSVLSHLEDSNDTLIISNSK